MRRKLRTGDPQIARNALIACSRPAVYSFFLSELRMYVLHAFGLINWVWY